MSILTKPQSIISPAFLYFKSNFNLAYELFVLF